MSKKIIFSALLICVVAGLVAVGTWAAFRDVETSHDNLFTAGSMDLKVDGEDDPYVRVMFDNITCVKPGDSGDTVVTLSNVGCVDGMADIHFMITENDENVAEEPELNVGDIADDPADIWDGELAYNLWIRVTADLDGDGTYETPVCEDPISEINSQNFVYGALDAGTSIVIKIEWWVPAETSNIIMTDTLKFDIEFSLDQAMAACLQVVSIDQPAIVQENELVDISVDVRNQGGAAGECTLDVQVTYPDDTVLAEALGVPTGMIDPLQTVSVSVFDDLLIPVPDPPLAKPYTLTVTVTPGAECCDQTPVTCEIEVVAPACLHAVSIDQPTAVAVGDNVTIAVNVHNQGGKPGSCTVTAWIEGLGGPLVGPIVVDTGIIAPFDTVKIPIGTFQAEDDWQPGVAVMAMACCDVEPIVCIIQVGPPPPGLSSRWIYDVNYDSDPLNGGVENDSVWTTHLVALVDPIPDAGACMAPPQVVPPPGSGAQVDISIVPSVARVAAGTAITVIAGSGYANPLDGTLKYVTTSADASGTAMTLEIAYTGYTLLSDPLTTNIGKPYTAGSSWTYDTDTVALIPLPSPGMFMCMSYAHVDDILVTVEAEPGTISVPAGNFSDCFKITTDVVPGDGKIKTDWWSPTTQGVVKTVDNQSFTGTETWVLTSWTIAP